MTKLKLILIICLVFLTGCATKAEVRRFIFGMNLSDFENSEKKFSQTVDKNIDKTYADILEYVKKCRAVINVKEDNDYFLVLYKFDRLFAASIDTTEVGVKLNKVDENKTEISIASDNYELAKFVLNIFVTGNIPEPQKKQKPI